MSSVLSVYGSWIQQLIQAEPKCNLLAPIDIEYLDNH